MAEKEEELLCAVCGKPRPVDLRPCPHCGEPGIVVGPGDQLIAYIDTKEAKGPVSFGLEAVIYTIPEGEKMLVPTLPQTAKLHGKSGTVRLEVKRKKEAGG